METLTLFPPPPPPLIIHPPEGPGLDESFIMYAMSNIAFAKFAYTKSPQVVRRMMILNPKINRLD